jgi:hypothetical protein
MKQLLLGRLLPGSLSTCPHKSDKTKAKENNRGRFRN